MSDRGVPLVTESTQNSRSVNDLYSTTMSDSFIRSSWPNTSLYLVLTSGLWAHVISVNDSLKRVDLPWVTQWISYLFDLMWPSAWRRRWFSDHWEMEAESQFSSSCEELMTVLRALTCANRRSWLAWHITFLSLVVISFLNVFTATFVKLWLDYKLYSSRFYCAQFCDVNVSVSCSHTSWTELLMLPAHTHFFWRDAYTYIYILELKLLSFRYQLQVKETSCQLLRCTLTSSTALTHTHLHTLCSLTV